LAGGTAIGHYLGHRRSRDLDFFSLTPGLDLDMVSRALTGSTHGEHVEILNRTDATLQVRLESIPVDIVSYPYPPLEQPESGPEGFPTASLVDLAAMKVGAIASRGIRRDFWDLWAICHPKHDLAWALDAYERRFAKVAVNRYHALRALSYFGDAERTKRLPVGMNAALWKRIRAYFEQEVPALLLADSR
jgi:hypothetical protein